MSTKTGYETTRMILMAAVVVLVVLACAPPASAQSRCWTTVGSAGTVDEADLGIVNISGDHTAVRGDVDSSTVDIRYNVVAVDGVFGGERNMKTMTVRFVDNGDHARVVVELRELDLVSGSFRTLAELDSNEFPPHFQAQAREIGFNCGDKEFDFANKVYYIAVKLVKTGAAGNPLLRGIDLCGNGIC